VINWPTSADLSGSVDPASRRTDAGI